MYRRMLLPNSIPECLILRMGLHIPDCTDEFSLFALVNAVCSEYCNIPQDAAIFSPFNMVGFLPLCITSQYIINYSGQITSILPLFEAICLLVWYHQSWVPTPNMWRHGARRICRNARWEPRVGNLVGYLLVSHVYRWFKIRILYICVCVLFLFIF